MDRPDDPNIATLRRYVRRAGSHGGVSAEQAQADDDAIAAIDALATTLAEKQERASHVPGLSFALNEARHRIRALEENLTPGEQAALVREQDRLIERIRELEARLAAPLPSVGGDWVEGTIADLQRAAQVCIGEEQELAAPRTHYIAVFCNTVRLCRESNRLARDAAGARLAAQEGELAEAIRLQAELEPELEKMDIATDALATVRRAAEAWSSLHLHTEAKGLQNQ